MFLSHRAPHVPHVPLPSPALPAPPLLQAQEILLQLQAALLADVKLAESAKGRVLGRLAEADKKLVDGADEFLQLLDVAAYTQLVVCNRA
jgi:hypothetical protein